MSVLDWLFISLLSGAILFFVLSISFFTFGANQGMKYRTVRKKPPKQSKWKKQWKRRCARLKKNKKKFLYLALLFLFLSIGSLVSGGYARYYQSTNLNDNDGEIIVQSYFLVGEVEKALRDIQEGADAEKTLKKSKEILSILISYTNQMPSENLNEEGQQLLRRYYTRMKEFGLNVDNQSVENLKKETVIEELIKDVNKIKKEQQVVFKTYSINEAALIQKK